MSSVSTAGNFPLKIFGSAFFLTLFFIGIYFFEPAALLFIIILSALLLVSFLNPIWGLLIFLFVRPLLDIITDYPIFSIGQSSVNLASLLAIAMVVFSSSVAWKNRKALRVLPIIFPFIAFLVITFISIFYSQYFFVSLAEWLRILSIFAIYVATFFTIKTTIDFRKLMLAIIFSAIIPSLLAIYQFFTATGMTIPSEDIYNRIFGTFVHPNVFAHFLVVPLAILVLFILNDLKKNTLRPTLLLPLIFFMTILTLTYTRSAWLAFLAIIFIVGIMRYHKLLLTSFAILILIYILIEPIRMRVDSLLSSDPQSSTQWRIQLYKDTWGYIQASPLLGQGTGTAREVILEQRGIQLGSSDAHNDYFKILLENGAIGIIAYLAVVLNLLKTTAKSYLRDKSNESLVILALTFALFSIALVDNIFRNTPLQWEYWALVGALLALNNNLKK